MKYMYFWDAENQRVIEEPNKILINTCQPYLGMWCLDDRSDNREYGRYGMFSFDKDFNGDHWWVGGPVSCLPNEFRTALLLLGVS